MNTLLAATVLSFSLLTQTPQPSDRIVVLIIQGQVEIVKESDARAEYERLLKIQKQVPSANARFVALVHALGTVSDPQSLPRNNTREFILNEVRRGVRKPLQAENY